MKKTLLFLLLFIFQYPYLFCQNSNDSSSNSLKKISYYRVKEIINSPFGGSISSYTASDIRLIKKTDLGPGNQRIITPVYQVETKKSRNQLEKTSKMISLHTKVADNTIIELTKKESSNEKTNPLESNEKDFNNSPPKTEKAENTIVNNNTEKKYVYINVVKTYEVVANKGYKSVKMFKEIADSYYFKKDFDKAVIWYDKLFAMKEKLESNYYYRYADTLIKIGKIKQGNKLMQKFNSLNGTL